MRREGGEMDVERLTKKQKVERVSVPCKDSNNSEREGVKYFGREISSIGSQYKGLPRVGNPKPIS